MNRLPGNRPPGKRAARLVKHIAAIGLTLSLLLGASACSGPPQLSGEAVIYVAAPLSGDQADGGQSVLGGVRKRAEEANLAGGVLGSKKVVVRGLDDQADETVAADVANQVAQAISKGDTVLGVIGHYNSGPTGVALDVYQKLNLVVITPSSSNPDLTRRGITSFFRVCATDATQGPFVAKFMSEQGFKRIALMHTDNDYAKGLAKEFTGGGAQPVVEITMKAESQSFAKEVAKAKEANPDAIFFAGDYPDGIVLVRELRQAGITAPVVASDANFVDYFIDELGNYAEGAYVSAISPDPRVVATSAWLDEYKTLEARNPGIDSTTGYSAADVLLTAIKKANTADGRKLADTIRTLDLKSLVGNVKYDANGDLVDQKVYLFKVEGGRFQQVYPKPG
jgi:branched-chain amino acid transport system substrate-binding protein